MIEIFSKQQDWLTIIDNQRIIPIYISDDISSLSAILLNEDYYSFLKNSTTVVEGISLLKAEYIIPFKAKAWLDLKERKANGEHVDSKNIKKHKNDIFRLSMLLTEKNHLKIPNTVKEDMEAFIKVMKATCDIV